MDSLALIINIKNAFELIFNYLEITRSSILAVLGNTPATIGWLIATMKNQNLIIEQVEYSGENRAVD